MKKFVIFCCLLLCSVSLNGCSLFFAGFPLSGKQELVFSCDDSIRLLKEEVQNDSGGNLVAESVVSQGNVSESSVAESNTVVSNTEETITPAASTLEAGLVDLNTATLEQLQTLNGIGETRAKAILEYREKHGPFTKKEDIMQVPGIKEGIYKKLQNQIAVR